MQIGVIIALIHTLCSGQADWKDYVQKKEAYYVEWSQDNNGGDKGRFLNDKVICLKEPNSAQEAKEVVYFLALYGEWNETPPECAKEVLRKYSENFKGMEVKKLTVDGVSDAILVALGKKAAPVKVVTVQVKEETENHHGLVSVETEPVKKNHHGLISVETDSLSRELESKNRIDIRMDIKVRMEDPLLDLPEIRQKIDHQPKLAAI